jgi:hypothetical protein
VILGKPVHRTQHCNSEDRQGVTGCGDLRAPSLSLGAAAKTGLAVKLRVSVLKAVAKGYFPTAGQWIIFSQALERFLPQYCFQQHHKIG